MVVVEEDFFIVAAARMRFVQFGTLSTSSFKVVRVYVCSMYVVYMYYDVHTCSMCVVEQCV